MSKQIQDAYIVAVTRTPVAKRKGMYRNVRPDDLLAHVLKSVMAQAPGLDPALIGDVISRAILGLAGARAEMRGDDDSRHIKERGLGDGLGIEHVEGSAGDGAVAHCLCQVGLVDDPASGDVDDAHVRLGTRQHGRIEQVDGVLVLRQMDGDEVRSPDQ